MSVYREIYEKISAHQDETMNGDELRLIKLSEEVGEVMQAYIGHVGANRRKGKTHSEIDVAKELADVVVTAMVALHDWVWSPEEFMKDHLKGLLNRIEEEGS